MKKRKRVEVKQDWIMGSHCLEEVLRYQSNRIVQVFLIKNSENIKKRKKVLLDTFKSKKTPFRFVANSELTSMVHTDSHQGIVAKVTKRKYFSLKEMRVTKENSFFLMLDHINDPQNFGSLLRLAECFKVDGVIFSKHRSSPITPVVTKASCGASELLRLVMVSNLATSLQYLQKNDYSVVVADMKKDSFDISSFVFPKKTVLVLGSEGKGVQPLIKKISDKSVYIPMRGRIESLNVSQAAAIFLAKWSESIKT